MLVTTTPVDASRKVYAEDWESDSFRSEEEESNRHRQKGGAMALVADRFGGVTWGRSGRLWR